MEIISQRDAEGVVWSRQEENRNERKRNRSNEMNPARVSSAKQHLDDYLHLFASSATKSCRLE